MVQDSDGSAGVCHASEEAHRKLEEAKQFLHNGKYLNARDICRELLKEHTEYVSAMMLLGQVYVALQDYNAALPCFSRAAMLSPNEPSICAQLAQNYFHLGAGQMALHTAELALSLQPQDTLADEVHLLLGRVYAQQADFERAGEHLEKALSINPELNEATLLQVRCLLELGEWDKAANAYASIPEGNLSLMERSWIVFKLAGHADTGAAKDILVRIEELSGEGAIIDDKKQRTLFEARLELARASIHEVQEKHKAAWKALKAGNIPMHKLYAGDYVKSKSQLSHTLRRAAGWNFAGAAAIPDGSNPPLSLLILGPSQAGKTILERLIGAIEGSRPGHESNIVHTATSRTCNSEGLMTLQFPGQLPRSIHEALTETYVDELSLCAPEAKLFTITHPGMIMDLGPIAETIPRMRVIFVDRDVDDTAFRIFGKVDGGETSCFANDVACIYEYLESYRQLTAAWAECLPGLTMRVSYEEMISDPKKILKQIAEFCDLPVPRGKLPDIVDDRGCAKPYLEHLKSARTSSQK